MTRNAPEKLRQNASCHRRGDHRGYRQLHSGVTGAVTPGEAGGDCQSAAGQGHRARPCKDRQNRRRHAGSLYAAGYLSEIWTPDAATERMRRLVARRDQVVRHRTRIKNEVYSILYARLIPRCPHADLFGRLGRTWLLRQPVPVMSAPQSSATFGGWTGWVTIYARLIDSALADAAIKRLLTITGVNLAVAAGLMAAIGGTSRPSSTPKASLLAPSPCMPQLFGAINSGELQALSPFR